jgi:membrane protein
MAIRQDALYDVAAGLAFYALLALVPFLLLCVLLASLVLDQQSPDAVAHIVGRVAPDAASALVLETIHDTVRALAASARGGMLLIAIGAAVWATSKATGALVRALNLALHVTETRRPLFRWILKLGVTASAGALTAGLVVVDVSLPVVLPYASTLEAVRWLRFPITGGLAMLLWTALYRLLPAHPVRRSVPSLGAAAGVAMWLLASWGFSLYVEHVKDFGVLYGGFAGILVLLFWLWLSSFALILGASIDRLLDRGRQDVAPA